MTSLVRLPCVTRETTIFAGWSGSNLEGDFSADPLLAGDRLTDFSLMADCCLRFGDGEATLLGDRPGLFS